MSEIYKEECNFFTQQDEVEVVFSLMTDKELMEMRERIEEVVKGKIYEEKEFPLSCAGLRFLQATIMFSFWVRKGKGVKIVEGEVVVCELEESPFWQRYRRQPKVIEDDVYEPEEPGHERDQTEMVEGEWV